MPRLIRRTSTYDALTVQPGGLRRQEWRRQQQQQQLTTDDVDRIPAAIAASLSFVYRAVLQHVRRRITMRNAQTTVTDDHRQKGFFIRRFGNETFDQV